MMDEKREQEPKGRGRGKKGRGAGRGAGQQDEEKPKASGRGRGRGRGKGEGRGRGKKNDDSIKPAAENEQSQSPSKQAFMANELMQPQPKKAKKAAPKKNEAASAAIAQNDEPVQLPPKKARKAAPKKNEEAATAIAQNASDEPLQPQPKKAKKKATATGQQPQPKKAKKAPAANDPHEQDNIDMETSADPEPPVPASTSKAPKNLSKDNLQASACSGAKPKRKREVVPDSEAKKRELIRETIPQYACVEVVIYWTKHLVGLKPKVGKNKNKQAMGGTSSQTYTDCACIYLRSQTLQVISISRRCKSMEEHVAMAIQMASCLTLHVFMYICIHIHAWPPCICFLCSRCHICFEANILERAKGEIETLVMDELQALKTAFFES